MAFDSKEKRCIQAIGVNLKMASIALAELANAQLDKPEQLGVDDAMRLHVMAGKLDDCVQQLAEIQKRTND